MVAVVLLTTLITPLIMRGAFAIHCPQDVEDFFFEEGDGRTPDSGDFPMAEIQRQTLIPSLDLEDSIRTTNRIAH